MRILPRARGCLQLSFEIEHILPIGCGGDDQDENKALSCRSCNLFKSNHLDGFDKETEQSVPLFNPRQDQWAEHFQVNRQMGAILGITACGRATVERLRFNSLSQISARMAWMQIGAFP